MYSLFVSLCLKALMYNRVVDDLMSWMDDVESQLMSEDHGKDLYSVNKLLKKHQVFKLYNYIKYMSFLKIDTLVICLIQNDKICWILSSSWNKTLAITRKKFKMFKMPPMCSRNPNILWTKNFKLEPKKFKKSKSIITKSKLTDTA